MTTKYKILKKAKDGGYLNAPRLAAELGLSRQTVTRHLKNLVENGELVKIGSTRSARYLRAKRKVTPKIKSVILVKNNDGLQEDLVFIELDQKLNLEKKMRGNAHSIARYAFTEMLNNAIDHSRSDKIRVEAVLEKGTFAFIVRDYGIGIFSNVQHNFKLSDELQALEHVMKGKQTTDAKRHSGQGIFFTSRIADSFTIRSHRLVLKIDNDNDDIRVGDDRILRGTEIRFRIRSATRKSLQKLFQKYANEDFDFDRGDMRIKLNAQVGLISRSQAKRLAEGLDKYKRVVFDMAEVNEMGQGFADEIFRVFKDSHPDIDLLYVNASPAVEFMIKRALRSSNT